MFAFNFKNLIAFSLSFFFLLIPISTQAQKIIEMGETTSDTFHFIGNVGLGTDTAGQQLTLTKSLSLPTTTASDLGVIYKGADSFIHNFQHPTGDTAVPAGYNTFIGLQAGNFTMGETATAVNHASYNTGVGSFALRSNTTGFRNSALGYAALYSNTTGNNNSALGYAALNFNTTGFQNSALGYAALYSNTTGNNNSALGYNALYSNTTGYYNSALGYNALYSNTTGRSNSAFGFEAGRYLADGSTANADTDYSVFLGSGTKAGPTDGGTNQIVIGYNAISLGSNTVVLGNDSIVTTALKGDVGIGTTTPAFKLEVVGTGSFSQPVVVGTPINDDHAATKDYVDSAALGGGGGDSYWALSGSNLYASSTDWSVGIGTTTPTQQLSLTKSLSLPVTTASDLGVIYKGADRFIHNFQHPTGDTAVPGGYNTFIGVQAGNFTMGSTATSTFQASYNTGVGYQSLNANTTGSYNSAFGYSALFSNTTGYSNSALGYRALYYNTTGFSNSAIGFGALGSNTTGYSNSALGSEALYKNTTGIFNSALGYRALYANITGQQNSVIGTYALYKNTTGSYNSVLGYQALYANITGTSNSALGYNALYANTTGTSNSALGYNALYANTTGSSNSALGYNAGRYLAVGSTANTDTDYSVFLGSGTKAGPTDGGTNQIVIGYNAISLGSNTVVLGNDSIVTTALKGDIGIGTTTPAFKLEVVGTGSFSQPVVVGTPTDDSHAATKNYVDSAALGGGGDSFWVLSGSSLYASSTAYNVGIGTVSTPEKLTVNGNVQADAFYYSSDLRFKNNIEPIANSLNKIKFLKPVSFTWRKNGELSQGFIAQDLEKVLPELVKTDPNTGFKSIQYANLTAILTAGLQEQQKTIERLETELEIIKNRLEKLEK